MPYRYNGAPWNLALLSPVNPTTNTIGNSKPLDAWTVISCTPSSDGKRCCVDQSSLGCCCTWAQNHSNSWCSPTCPLNWSLIISNNWRKSMSNRSPFGCLARRCQKLRVIWLGKVRGWLSSHCIATKKLCFCHNSLAVNTNCWISAKLVFVDAWWAWRWGWACPCASWVLVWLSASYNWLICSRVSWKKLDNIKDFNFDSLNGVNSTLCKVIKPTLMLSPKTLWLPPLTVAIPWWCKRFSMVWSSLFLTANTQISLSVKPRVW